MEEEKKSISANMIFAYVVILMSVIVFWLQLLPFVKVEDTYYNEYTFIFGNETIVKTNWLALLGVAFPLIGSITYIAIELITKERKKYFWIIPLVLSLLAILCLSLSKLLFEEQNGFANATYAPTFYISIALCALCAVDSLAAMYTKIALI